MEGCSTVLESLKLGGSREGLMSQEQGVVWYNKDEAFAVCNE